MGFPMSARYPAEEGNVREHILKLAERAAAAADPASAQYLAKAALHLAAASTMLPAAEPQGEVRKPDAAK